MRHDIFLGVVNNKQNQKSYKSYLFTNQSSYHIKGHHSDEKNPLQIIFKQAVYKVI